MTIIFRAASRLLSVALALLLSGQFVFADQVYTTDADFDEGTLVNVNHDAPFGNQLQLDEITSVFPFINVAASNRGTVVRINTATGQIIGEYRTAPEGRGLNPSRTTVDLFGNVWTGNRNESGLISGILHGSVVKIGLALGGTRVDADGSPNPLGEYLQPPMSYNTCVDRDSDGLIKTSRGSLDILNWPDVTDGVGGVTALVEDADDECILIYQRLPNAEAARHVSVDADNNVWVGGYPFAQRFFHKLDGNSGAILASFDARRFVCGGYGGLIDGSGILWSASISQHKLLRYDPVSDTGTCVNASNSYGLGIDTNGYIWNSQWTSNLISKISSGGVVEIGFPKSSGGSGSRGVAVTAADNNVWVANSYSNTVSRLDNTGTVLKIIHVGTHPTGVAVDAIGKVWVTNYNSDNAMRIDPNAGGDGLGAVDLTVDLGPGAGPYNYSDMTGIVASGSTSPQGIWTVVHNGGSPGRVWGAITWNTEPEAYEPAGTSITVMARAADSLAGLTSEVFMTVTSGGALVSMAGQFIEIQTTLRPDLSGVSPVLSDLSVVSDDEPPIASNLLADPNPAEIGTLVTITANIDDSTTGDSNIISAAYTVDGVPAVDGMDAFDGAFDSPTENVTASRTFAAAAVHTICVTGDDAVPLTSNEICALLAVYDPSAGFVTGGGWIDSPAGAYVPDPVLFGKATFGFVSKYKKGKSTPDGNTQFQFHAAGMKFKSTSYDWLVIAGKRAMYKGTGTINGAGNFGFMLFGIDGDLQGGDGIDKFRIKIWDKDNGDMVVYDNEIGVPDDADATTAIGGGSIVIHKK